MEKKLEIKYDTAYKEIGDKRRRIDLKYHFVTDFYKSSGKYIRSGIIEDARDSGKDPYRASFPHLIDVGIMGSCQHGKSGLCRLAGIGCYQSGGSVAAADMSLSDFQKIADESEHLVDQFALGGRGDPDCHKDFEEILKYCKKRGIVPNYTTSGFAFNERKAELSRKYCGAVAVSWYRSEYTLRAIQMLLDAGVKTNIHYVLGKNSIDEAIERLQSNDFPKGVNAVIFLLHKPAGQGTKANMLEASDHRVAQFFAEVDKHHPFKVGMDSCNVPGAINFCKSILPESLDTCEGGRYSCYIGADMIMVPCSFDQEKRYEVSLRDMSITEAWNSEPFERFRNKMRGACPDCEKKELCMGGCPLMPEIVFCESGKRKIL